MSMRTWKNRLYLDAMPGRKFAGRLAGNFSRWLREMEEHRIGTVVCLAPEEQIAAESPQYRVWRERRRHRQADGTGKSRVTLIDLPIDDLQAPALFAAGRFWNTARHVAELIDNGERVFIHCAAGIGRTGMFAVAVLMSLGYDYPVASREIAGVGSLPETPAQREFLKRGPSGGR